MSDADNPYRAPDAPVSDDFIAYEPIRRPMAYTVAAALCWFMAVTLVIGLGYNLVFVIRLGIERGWRDVIPPGLGPGLTVSFFLCGILSSILIVAGRSFFARKGRRGLYLVGVAWALGYAISRILPLN